MLWAIWNICAHEALELLMALRHSRAPGVYLGLGNCTVCTTLAVRGTNNLRKFKGILSPIPTDPTNST